MLYPISKQEYTETMTIISRIFIGGLIVWAVAACRNEPAQEEAEETQVNLSPDPDNGGLKLPPGFSALVVADSLGRGRHLAVSSNGDIYLRLRKEKNGGTLVALRDTTNDGRADLIEYFGPDIQGTGIGIQDNYLYYSTDTSVHRYALNGDLVPDGEPEQIVGGLVYETQHAAKSITFDDQGNIYVNVGAPSNACMEQSRTAGSKGMDPCPLLERYGGIWRFNKDQLGQTQTEHGYRYATGLRNSVALGWNPVGSALFAVPHGRDDLHGFWKDLYTEEQNRDLPSEEFVLINDGDDFGWPYCYFDQLQGKKVLNPEYGGDGGTAVGRCADKKTPLIGFPGHYAPNDIVFYAGDQFPESYNGGAFIAFHGSWNRLGFDQEGFNVVFVPLSDLNVNGEWSVFADGFMGPKPITSPGDAAARPTGVAIGPDGSLYISDSVRGMIWRVFYSG